MTSLACCFQISICFSLSDVYYFVHIYFNNIYDNIFTMIQLNLLYVLRITNIVLMLLINDFKKILPLH